MQKNIHNLQVLRAFAATAVVYYHIVGTPHHIGPLPDFGAFGVDIFFCLSGFVMMMLVQNNNDTPRRFITHRLIRIAPIYWIFTSLIMVLTLVKPDLFNFTTSNWGNYFKSLFFIPYFKESGSMHPMLAVGWTLNYEMLFYFTIALAMIISKKWITLVTTLLILCIYLFGKFSSVDIINKFFGNELLFEFLFGIYIYHLWKKTQLMWISNTAALVIVIVSTIALAAIEANTLGINRTISFGIPAAIIFITTLKLEGTLNPQSKLTKILMAMGDASYATYITHFFVVMFIKKILYDKFNLIVPTSPMGVLLGIILCLIVGQLTYIMLDKPITHWLRKVTKPQKGSTERAFLKKA